MFYVLIAGEGANSIHTYDVFGNNIDKNIIKSDDSYRFGFEVAFLSPSVDLHTNKISPLGAFVDISLHDGSIYIRTDYLGMEPVIYSQWKDSTYVSNSFDLLVSKLRENGCTINPNINAITLHGIKSQVTMQVTSSNTIVENIYLLPAHSSLIISKGCPVVESFDIRNELKELSYEQLVTKGCVQMACLFRTLGKKFGVLQISLSGGRDSRAVLAGCQYAFSDQFHEYVQVRTGAKDRFKVDYEVAELLSENLVFL